MHSNAIFDVIGLVGNGFASDQGRLRPFANAGPACRVVPSSRESAPRGAVRSPSPASSPRGPLNYNKEFVAAMLREEAWSVACYRIRAVAHADVMSAAMLGFHLGKFTRFAATHAFRKVLTKGQLVVVDGALQPECGVHARQALPHHSWMPVVLQGYVRQPFASLAL